MTDWLRKLLPALTTQERARREQWCYRVNCEGCSGKGRPTCRAAECVFGAEPCPHCGGFKAVGQACAFVHRITFGR